MATAIPSNTAYFSNGYYYTTDGQQIPISGTQAQETSYISQTEADTLELSSAATSSETCTDGRDDGKIGLGSTIGNFVKGAVNGLVNGVKGMFLDENGNFSFKNTLKSAATIGACFIPGVGPFIAGGLCVVGVAKGASGIINSVSAASQATTDAEAKEALQSLGSSTLVTGLSAAGLKGATGAIVKSSGFKSILGKTDSVRSSIASKGVISTAKTLGSSITKPYSTAVSTGLEKAAGKGYISTAYNVSKEVVKTGAKGTAENAIGAARTIKDQATNTYNRVTGKTGIGTAEQVAKHLSTKNQTFTADDIQNALNNGGKINVGDKTYNISRNAGDDISYSLQNAKTQVKPSYSQNNATKTENLSLDDVKAQDFSKTEISKIESLKQNKSYTTKSGTKITKTEQGYTIETPATITKELVYDGISEENIAKYVGKNNANNILDNLNESGSTVGQYSKGKTNYYYLKDDPSLTIRTEVSPNTVKVHDFIDKATNTSNYTYTPIIADMTEEI
ncbi:MAG: hypothetical protein ACI37R_03395 [Candidatus Avigastranaerophilus sp.]